MRAQLHLEGSCSPSIQKLGYLCSGKTWASGTSNAARQQFRGLTIHEHSILVPLHKVEIGLLLRFNRKPCTSPVVGRWEDGLDRIDNLVHKRWSVDRKVATINRVVFPQLFAGCPSVHISLSTFQRFRGKLNVAVHSWKSIGSHFLSPLVTHSVNYEPFLYVYRTRLSALRATNLAFDTSTRDLWNSLAHVSLVEAQTQILGPVSCFLWSCQVVGWQILPDFQVDTKRDVVLHLLLSPMDQWVDVMEQSWWDYAYSKCKWKDEWRELQLSIYDWRALWSKAKHLPTLSLRFRTFGILSGTAVARMHGKDESQCELCGSQESGQRHLVLSCTATQPIQDKPVYQRLKFASSFMRCTGIPCRSSAWKPLQWQSVHIHPQICELTHIFTDGSASPPEFPSVRLSSWAVIGSSGPDHNFVPLASGLTPGYIHNIARAETFAVLQAITLIPCCTLYVDNQGVVTNFLRILEGGFNPIVWRGHSNYDLWVQIANVIVSRPPRSFHIIKVKSHLDPSAALTSTEAWKIRGNDKADQLAKSHLLQEVQHKPELHHRTQNYSRFIDDAVQCSFMLHEISQLVFQARKEKEDSGQVQAGQDDTPDAVPDPTVVYSTRVINFSNIPVSNTWDSKWLHLVAHYFSLLKWPETEPVHRKPMSMIEMMLDCFLAFQILPPVNLRLLKRDHKVPTATDVNQFDTQYVLFSRKEAALFPTPTLRDASYIWLWTFDYLQQILQLTPSPRSTLYALGNFGYCNSVPSQPVRPTLLCGQLVSQLLSNTLVPGVRVLKYPLVITPAEPRPFPPSFPPNFN